MTQPDRPMNVWDHKPWWCQPWSILLTGTALISSSWLLFHNQWITALIAVPVLGWMGFFLLLYPKLVVSGAEADLDTSKRHDTADSA